MSEYEHTSGEFEVPEDFSFDDITLQNLCEDFLRDEPQSDTSMEEHVLYGNKIVVISPTNTFEVSEDINCVDDYTFEALGIFLSDDECDKTVTEKIPVSDGCSEQSSVNARVASSNFKKSRKRRREPEDSYSKRSQSVSMQFMDCKTKNAITRGRHADIDSNILVSTPNKYYKQVDIISLSKGRTQLQTTCRCGRIRRFVRRRAVKKGVAITYSAAERCACDSKHTDQLRLCFCGALFRSAPSMFKCPCFGRSGPAFTGFPECARFAPRRCPCPHMRRHCSCLVHDE